MLRFLAGYVLSTIVVSVALAVAGAENPVRLTYLAAGLIVGGVICGCERHRVERAG